MKNSKKTNTNTDTNIQDDEQEDVISKSAVKRAMHDIVSFGEKLLALNPKKLSRLPLSDLLLSEIELAKKLKVDNSRRRQMQRIGKILRSENVEEIQALYDELEDQNRQHQQSGNPSEKWCAKLIDNTESLSEFIERYPDVSRQQLGQLTRNAKKEKVANGASTKNRQRLFKVIQETLTKDLS